MTRSMAIDVDGERLPTSARMLLSYNLREATHAA